METASSSSGDTLAGTGATWTLWTLTTLGTVICLHLGGAGPGVHQEDGEVGEPGGRQGEHGPVVEVYQHQTAGRVQEGVSCPLSPECRYPEHGRGEEARHQAQPEAGGQPQPPQRGRARHQGAEVEVVHGLDQRHQAEAERGHGDGGEAGHAAQAVLASYPAIPRPGHRLVWRPGYTRPRLAGSMAGAAGLG